jgi:hypothetical protein
MAAKVLYAREFNQIELLQIKELKDFMSGARDAKTWNFLRDEAKQIWDEKIISAVDGLYKWVIAKSPKDKSKICLGVKIQ